MLALSGAAGAQEPAAAPPAGHMMHGGGGAPGGHMAGLPKAAPADVASPEAIVNAYYEALSGPAGKKRDWNRFLSLFFPDARPANDAEPFVRGVTSFELLNNGQRWWIVNVAWQPETARLKLTAENLGQ